MSEQLSVRADKGKVWSHIRKMWLVKTPEEKVRQEYLCVLVNQYGFSLDQMDEELEVTGRGSGHARADFVIWRSAQDKADSNNPLIIVECKSDNITIRPNDYGQGDNYSRLSGARFFVTHNSRETKYWRVVHKKMPKTLEEISNIPHADASDKEIEELIANLKTFKEDEFADLLHQCHNVIRNREKLDPAAAFDEIAKILFVKVAVEREMKKKRERNNLFTVQYLDSQTLTDDPLGDLFNKTKKIYEDDQIFDPDEEINLKPATGREIVLKLERYNLSDTSEDIKGIAFERFLGRTFRGEIGQFFTPRTIVEFMIRMSACPCRPAPSARRLPPPIPSVLAEFAEGEAWRSRILLRLSSWDTSEQGTPSWGFRHGRRRRCPELAYSTIDSPSSEPAHPVRATRTVVRGVSRPRRRVVCE